MRPPIASFAVAPRPHLTPERTGGPSNETSHVVHRTRPIVRSKTPRRALSRHALSVVLAALGLSGATACASGGGQTARFTGSTRVAATADTASQCWESVSIFAGYIERASVREGLTPMATDGGLIKYGRAIPASDSVRAVWRDFGAMREGLGGEMTDVGAHYVRLANPAAWPIALTAPNGETATIQATPGDTTALASWCQSPTIVFEVRATHQAPQVMRLKRGLRGAAVGERGWVVEVRR